MSKERELSYVVEFSMFPSVSMLPSVVNENNFAHTSEAIEAQILQIEAILHVPLTISEGVHTSHLSASHFELVVR